MSLSADEVRTLILGNVPLDGSTVGNTTLRRLCAKSAEQEVAKPLYQEVRDQLVAEGRLAKGPGRGGSVRRTVTSIDDDREAEACEPSDPSVQTSDNTSPQACRFDPEGGRRDRSGALPALLDARRHAEWIAQNVHVSSGEARVRMISLGSERDPHLRAPIDVHPRQIEEVVDGVGRAVMGLHSAVQQYLDQSRRDSSERFLPEDVLARLATRGIRLEALSTFIQGSSGARCPHHPRFLVPLLRDLVSALSDQAFDPIVVEERRTVVDYYEY